MTWKEVVGFPAYEVSTDGSVRKVTGEVLPQYDNNEGRYKAVSLYFAGKTYRRRVHRLVAEAFIPNPECLPMVLHSDDNGSNNKASNLRWGTRTQNTNDAIRNGRHPHANKTHCKRGHEYTEDNTKRTRDGRACRKCIRLVDCRRKKKEESNG